MTNSERDVAEPTSVITPRPTNYRAPMPADTEFRGPPTPASALCEAPTLSCRGWQQEAAMRVRWVNALWRRLHGERNAGVLRLRCFASLTAPLRMTGWGRVLKLA